LELTNIEKLLLAEFIPMLYVAQDERVPELVERLQWNLEAGAHKVHRNAWRELPEFRC
jgi:hypothetical protein